MFIYNFDYLGLKGLQVASLLAANMLALSSIFNSASTMLSLDIWKRIRPQASDRELVFIGKLCVVAMTITGVAWLPVLQRVQGSQFWDYMMHINSYTTPPLLAVFVLGVFWSGTTEKVWVSLFLYIYVTVQIGITSFLLYLVICSIAGSLLWVMFGFIRLSHQNDNTLQL